MRHHACAPALRIPPAFFFAALGENKTLKSRVVALDAAARVVRTEVLQGGTVSAQLRTHFAEIRVEAAGEGACVAKVKVDYERLDGAPLAPEDEARLAQGYVRLVRMVEAYLVAHPDEFA